MVFLSSCDLSTQDSCHGRRDLRLAIIPYLRPIMKTLVTASRKRLWCAKVKLQALGKYDASIEAMGMHDIPGMTDRIVVQSSVTHENSLP